jgi:ribosome-associated protein
MQRTLETESEPSSEEATESPTRADVRRAERVLEESLAKLARELVALDTRKLQKLGLPETVLDTALAAQAIRTPAARNRQLRLVRTALREGDWGSVRARLDAFLIHGVFPAAADPSEPAASGLAYEWQIRLIGEGSNALEALLREHPNADRTHLRTLVRQVQKSAAERRTKAEQKLTLALRSLLRV